MNDVGWKPRLQTSRNGIATFLYIIDPLISRDDFSKVSLAQRLAAADGKLVLKVVGHQANQAANVLTKISNISLMPIAAEGPPVRCELRFRLAFQVWECRCVTCSMDRHCMLGIFLSPTLPLPMAFNCNIRDKIGRALWSCRAFGISDIPSLLRKDNGS